MKNIRRVLTLLKSYGLTAAGAIFAVILVSSANLVTPQLLKTLIDRGITGRSMTIVYWMAGLMVLFAIIRGVFTFLQGYWSEIVAQGLAYELRNKIFTKLQVLSFSFHDQSQTGKQMTRMTSDVEFVKSFVGQGLLQLLGGIILLVGTLIILFSMNWLLTIIYLLIIPPVGFIISIFARKMMPLSRLVQEKLGKLNTVLQENLTGIRIVKAFAREEYEKQRFQDKNIELKEFNLNLINTFASVFPYIFMIANLGTLGVVWVGGIQVMGKIMTLGELVAFVSYQGTLLMPIFMFGFIASALSRAEASAQRIYEVIDTVVEVSDSPDAIQLLPIKGEIEFDHVSFKYAGTDQFVIEDLSVKIQPDQDIAILGKTGSGKSSFVNLIPRFYDVSSGSIKIDGTDIRSVTIDSLRSQIGIVLQETTLFSGTIKENIRYGKPDASENEIIMAAKTAQAHEFINELPEGYDTLVGERGIGLSGGQKQRIAIARAILLQPRILIMDDSTSSVDTQTESLIQSAMESLRKGRTTLVIAQRISSVKDADQILLLDEGHLIAQGTHNELMRTSELYADILETQLGGHADLIASLEEVSQ